MGKRNILKPVIEQSEAIIFLHNRGYNLNDDYEAYQAIDLWKEIKRAEGIEDLPDDKTIQFDSIFTKNDNNIYRRRSIHRMSKIDDQTSVHTSLNKCNSEPELNNPNITYNPLNSNHYTNKDPLFF